MDLNFSKKEIKKFQKLGLTEDQIENHKREIIIEKILDSACDSVSEKTNRKIVFGKVDNGYKIFLVSKTGRYCEINVDYKELVCDFPSAYHAISEDLSTRLYFL